jgi:hypothetical protein
MTKGSSRRPGISGPRHRNANQGMMTLLSSAATRPSLPSAGRRIVQQIWAGDSWLGA